MQVDFEDAEETTLKKMAPQNGCCLVAQTVLPDLLPNCVQAYICRYRFWCSILLVLCAVTDVYLAVLDLSIRTSTPPSLLFMATVCGVGSSDVRKRLFVCKGGGESRGVVYACGFGEQRCPSATSTGVVSHRVSTSSR